MKGQTSPVGIEALNDALKYRHWFCTTIIYYYFFILFFWWESPTHEVQHAVRPLPSCRDAPLGQNGREDVDKKER